MNRAEILHSRLQRSWAMCLVVALLLCCGGAAVAAPSGTDLTAMSLEQLLEVKVTTVSRKAERVVDTAAAVTVITADEIRRCGATSIPEVLRLVPGLHVAHIDANKWAINARGFNHRFARQLLVLIDGRTVYSPMFGGVWWDVQDTMLEDIDRIEVIRGPGATMWGANAVNGVINIVTRDAHATANRGLATGYVGSSDGKIGAYRYGGSMANGGAFRFFVKGADHEFFPYPNSTHNGDSAWQQSRFGFRADWETKCRKQISVQGDLYRSRNEEISQLRDLTAPLLYQNAAQTRSDASGGDLMASVRGKTRGGRDWQVRLSYDRSFRNDVMNVERRDTFDIDYQLQFKPAPRHDVVAGTGWRWTSDDLPNTNYLWFTPNKETTTIFNLFVQDDITLCPEKLNLIIGAKFEHHSQVGNEVEPSARLLWRAHKKHTLYASVSRAAQLPSRVERTGWGVAYAFPRAVFPPLPAPQIPIGVIPVVGTLQGNPDYESGIMTAREIGWRFNPSRRFALDTSAFRHDYAKMLKLSPAVVNQIVVDGAPRAVTVSGSLNDVTAHAGGFEATTRWQLGDRVRLSTGHTWLWATPSDGGDHSWSMPDRQTQIRAAIDLRKNLDLDLAWFDVAGFDYFGIAGRSFNNNNLQGSHVPGYQRFDVRFGYRPFKDFELAVGGQNLGNKSHYEFGPTWLEVPSEVPRVYYVKGTWNF